MDIATLGLAVDSSEVADASADLERLREASARAERAADSFGAKTEAAGRRAAAANDNAAQSANRASKAYEGYGRAAALAATAIGAIVGTAVSTAFVQFADIWSDISSRVGIAVGDMDAAPAVLARIAQTARMTYSNLELTAEGFVRNATVLNELGKSTQQQLDYQEALNNALVVSGAKGRAAEFVQESFNRSMALGAMRGIELNNVLNYGGRVAELLAKHFNTTTGGLMKLAQQGKITGDVLFNVLTQNMEALREEAESMPATIGDGMILIRNALLQFIGSADQALGVSETFAAGLIIIADNIGRIVTIGATAVTMYGTYYVAAFIAARVATLSLVGSLELLRTILIRTGVGAVVALVGELVYQFGRLVEATGSWGAALQEVGQRAKILLDAVVWGFRAVGDTIVAVWSGAMADILRTTEDTFGGILRLLGVSAESMAASISRLENRAADMGEAARSSAIVASEQFKTAFADIELPELDLGGNGGTAVKSLEEVDKAAKKAAESYKRIVDSAQEFVAAQQLEASVIGMSEQAANALRYEFDLLNEAKRAGIELSAADRQGFRALAEAMAEAEERTRSLQDTFDFVKGTIQGFFSDLRRGLSDGKTFWDSFSDAAVNALNKIADKLIEMALDQMINNVLGNLMRALGGGFGGMGTNYFPPAPSGGFHTMAGGGQVRGPGTATSDSIPAWLSNGEFVVNAAAVSQPGVLPLLEAINGGNMAVRMAMGGLARVQAPANSNVGRFGPSNTAQGGAPSVNIRVDIQNEANAPVEVGEPRQDSNGDIVLPMLIKQVEDKMVESMHSGRLGRATQATYGLKKVTR